MESELGKYLNALKKGDKISIVLAGIIVDGTFEELVDNCLVLSDATSPTIKKKHYSLSIPTESIYAWGKKEKKGK
ncbi:MAG TPA: hypothetical protein VK206_19375 [Anaerolineales bacterium]|nr:hypothetical protein [Anaerolineales bacterium]HLO31846.1 hypothetical protein [Anaerolineales bacterium]